MKKGKQNKNFIDKKKAIILNLAGTDTSSETSTNSKGGFTPIFNIVSLPDDSNLNESERRQKQRIIKMFAKEDKPEKKGNENLKEKTHE